MWLEDSAAQGLPLCSYPRQVTTADFLSGSALETPKCSSVIGKGDNQDELMAARVSGAGFFAIKL